MSSTRTHLNPLTVAIWSNCIEEPHSIQTDFSGLYPSLSQGNPSTQGRLSVPTKTLDQLCDMIKEVDAANSTACKLD